MTMRSRLGVALLFGLALAPGTARADANITGKSSGYVSGGVALDPTGFLTMTVEKGKKKSVLVVDAAMNVSGTATISLKVTVNGREVEPGPGTAYIAQCATA